MTKKKKNRRPARGDIFTTLITGVREQADKDLAAMSPEQKIEWLTSQSPELLDQVKQHIPKRILRLLQNLNESDWQQDWQDAQGQSKTDTTDPTDKWLNQQKRHRLVQTTRLLRSALILVLREVDNQLLEADDIAKYVKKDSPPRTKADDEASKIVEDIIK